MSVVFVIDFDNTVALHGYPSKKTDLGAAPVLRKIVDAGHRIILSTMRCDEAVEAGIFESGLTDAVNWFNERGIPLYGIQKNPTQWQWTTSPKCHGDIFIDDRGLGVPVKYDENISELPFVDWLLVEEMLVRMGLIPQ